jgi:tetratricopeptide (TPR) repeat protein
MPKLFIASFGVALALTAGTLDTAQAQAPDDGVISLEVTLEDGESLGTLPRSYRLYDETASVPIALSIGNLSENPIVIDQEAIRRMFRARVRASSELPVSIQWLSEIRLPGSWIPVANSWTPLSIEPQMAVTWLGLMESRDGNVFRGRYSLEYEIPGIMAAISKLDGTRWVGRVPSLGATLGFSASRPGSPRERAAMHRVTARQATFRSDWLKALEAYSSALASDPADLAARGGIGASLMALGRYAEAIPVYEQLLPTAPRGALTYDALAIAYLATGDEVNARRILRQSGLSEERVSTKVAELREANRRRP